MLFIFLLPAPCPVPGAPAVPGRGGGGGTTTYGDDSYRQASHLLASSWFLFSAHYCLLLTFLFCDVFEGYLLPELCNYTKCHLSPVKMCFHCELLEIISALCRYNGYLLHIDNMTKMWTVNNKQYLAKRMRNTFYLQTKQKYLDFLQFCMLLTSTTNVLCLWCCVYVCPVVGGVGGLLTTHCCHLLLLGVDSGHSLWPPDLRWTPAQTFIPST